MGRALVNKTLADIMALLKEPVRTEIGLAIESNNSITFGSQERGARKFTIAAEHLIEEKTLEVIVVKVKSKVMYQYKFI